MSEKKDIRIGQLNTVGGVVTELGRVYRKARRGEIDMGDAKSLTYVLREIRCALEYLNCTALHAQRVCSGNPLFYWSVSVTPGDDTVMSPTGVTRAVSPTGVSW